MDKLFAAVQLAIIAFFAIAPVFHYRRVDDRHSRFYIKMAADPRARLVYRIALALLIMTVNICSLVMDGPYVWQFPGMILAALLIPDKCTAAILRWLHDDKRAQLAAFAVFFGTMAVPQLFTLSVSLGMLMIGAFFYPSWSLSVYIMKFQELKDETTPCNEFYMLLYFASKRAGSDVSFLDP